MTFDLKIEYRINDLSSADHYDQKKNPTRSRRFLIFVVFTLHEL